VFLYADDIFILSPTVSKLQRVVKLYTVGIICFRFNYKFKNLVVCVLVIGVT